MYVPANRDRESTGLCLQTETGNLQVCACKPRQGIYMYVPANRDRESTGMCLQTETGNYESQIHSVKQYKYKFTTKGYTLSGAYTNYVGGKVLVFPNKFTIMHNLCLFHERV